MMSTPTKAEKIENLYHRATTPGERAAAAEALRRMGHAPPTQEPPQPKPPPWQRYSPYRAPQPPPYTPPKPPPDDVARFVAWGVVLHAEWCTLKHIGERTRETAARLGRTKPTNATIEKRLFSLREIGLLDIGWIRNTVTPVFRLKPKEGQ